MPHMNDCIDSRGEAVGFSTLHANSEYWRVESIVEDRDKVTFTSHRGLYRFVRVPVGLGNPASKFQ